MTELLCSQPLARRDDSSTSSDDSSDGIPPLNANSNRRAVPSQDAATGPPSSVMFETSSSEGSDDEDLSDDEDASDASDDYSSDDIPALVVRFRLFHIHIFCCRDESVLIELLSATRRVVSVVWRFRHVYAGAGGMFAPGPRTLNFLYSP